MNYNNNHIPLVRLLLPFIVGIVGAIYLKPELSLLLFIFGATFSLFIALLLIKKVNTNYKFRGVFGLLIYFNFIAAGAVLTSVKYKNTDSTSKLLTNQNNQLLIGAVHEPIQTKENSTKAILEIRKVKINNTWIKGNGKVLIYFQKDSLSQSLNLGDLITFAPKLVHVAPPKNPNEFDFKKYLSYHFIHQQAFLRANEWKLIRKNNVNGIVQFANNSRKHLIHILEQKGIKGRELAVASALILGQKEGINTELKSAYSSAGAMHILAVSGLHVGIIFLLFNQLLLFVKRIKYGKVIQGILIIFILWSYALLAGLSPSVMRATTMFSFIVLAKMTNRNTNIFNTLAASALVLLIYNPLLIMEVGFQLSYLAVIGIVIIQPWINNWFNFKWWISIKIWEITAVSIAAQIATFPLGLLYFHQFPNYFILSNLIVIPLAVLILYLGVLSLSLSIIPIVSDYLILALKYVVQFLNTTVSFIDQLPHSLSENIRFDIADTWLIYLVIAAIILLVTYRKFKFLLAGSSFFILFLITRLWINYMDVNQQQLIVYNIPQCSAINFIDGNNNVLLADSQLIKKRSKLLFHVQNN